MQIEDQSVIQEQVEKSREAIEALEPSIFERKLKFRWTTPEGQPIDRVYTQAMLGMFPMQEFSTMVTEILNGFVEGDMGMKLGELFRGDVEMPVSFDPDTVNKTLEENIQLFKAIIKLVQILPDFQLDVMCLSLGVPRREHAWAKEQMQEPPHRGGLTVEEGFDILIVFLKQNADLVRDTVKGKARELVDTFRLEILGQDLDSESETEEETEEPSSPGMTPSSTSSPDIPVNV